MNRSLWPRRGWGRRLPALLAALLASATASLPAAETNGVVDEPLPVEATNGAPPLPPEALSWAETNAADLTATLSAPARPGVADDQTLRSYLELQAKLHSALLAIEQARREAGAASSSNAALLTERLRQLEDGFATQRDRERDLAAQANRTLLIAAGGFAALGIVALGLVVFFQMRGLNRLAEIATTLPAARALGMGLSLPPPGPDGSPVPAVPGPETDPAQFLGVISRLERRIHELEHTARSQPATTVVRDGPRPPTDSVRPENADRVRALMEKAQALADLGRADEAVGCFDEVLAVEAAHGPAQLGKAKALETLGRLTDAIACSDEALKGDPRWTRAWLLKARLLQQLGRDKEALHCYEQALAGANPARSGD